MLLFQAVTPCRPTCRYQRFEEIYYFHLQGRSEDIGKLCRVRKTRLRENRSIKARNGKETIRPIGIAPYRKRQGRDRSGEKGVKVVL
jgi:hypothetical protein